MADLEKERRVVGALVDALFRRGLVVSVWDGEEWAVRGSGDKREILAALWTTDMETVSVGAVGSFVLIHGNDGYDVVADHTGNEFCNEIMAEIQPVIDREEARR